MLENGQIKVSVVDKPSITVALSFSDEIVTRWLDVFGAKPTKL